MNVSRPPPWHGDGGSWPSHAPGLGVDLDEAAAAKHPPVPALAGHRWTDIRLPDGAAARP